MTPRQVLLGAINYRSRAIIKSPQHIGIIRIWVPRSGIRRGNRRSWRSTRPRPTRCGVARGIHPLVPLEFAFVVFVTTALRLRGIRVRIPTRCRKRTGTQIVALYLRRHRRRPRVTFRMLTPGVDRPVRVYQACLEVADPFLGRTLGILDPTNGHLQHLLNRPTRLAHVLRPQKDGRHPELGVRDDSRYERQRPEPNGAHLLPVPVRGVAKTRRSTLTHPRGRSLYDGERSPPDRDASDPCTHASGRNRFPWGTPNGPALPIGCGTSRGGIRPPTIARHDMTLRHRLCREGKQERTPARASRPSGFLKTPEAARALRPKRSTRCGRSGNRGRVHSLWIEPPPTGQRTSIS